MGEQRDSRKSILVVDDEDDLRHLVGRVLTDCGFAVREATDGGAALASIRAHPPDLVVLDLMMPVMDGWGVLARLNALDKPPAVVILTARGDEQSFTRCVQAGVAGYLAKPFQLADLIGTCRRLTADTSAEAPEGIERRRLPRRDLMVKVRVLLGAEKREPSKLGALVNVSSGGAQIKLPAGLEPGSFVRVGLHIAADRESLRFEGRILWRAEVDEGFAHGIEFVDLDETTRQRLEDLLRAAA